MKDSKYIELLRYYLFTKMDELNDEELSATAENIIEIISTVFSALISALIPFFLPSDTNKNPAMYIILVVVLSAAFFGIQKGTKWIIIYRKHKKEDGNYAQKQLDANSAKKLVSKFDNVACDGLILAHDFLSMHDSNADGTMNQDASMKKYYLYEAFYYYKKTIDILEKLLEYRPVCVGVSGGVAHYRVMNVYNALETLESHFHKYFTSTFLQKQNDLQTEVEIYEERLLNIAKKLGIEKKKAEIT